MIDNEFSMNEPLHNTETLRDRKLETISAITVLGIVLTITAYILYYCENKYRSEYYVKEKGFATITAPQFDGPAGENQQLKLYAQSMLDSPKSYKHIETIYIHNNDQEFFLRSIFSGKFTHEAEEILCLKAIYSSKNQTIKNPTAC